MREVYEHEDEEILVEWEEPTEPEEGDYTTEDHCRFYQDGKLALTISAESTTGEMWTAIMNHMHREKFYPNVWFISDHGNAHLMSPTD